MLDTLTYSAPPTVVKVPVRPVNGHGRRAFKHLSKSQRAALAVAVMHGEASLQPTLAVMSRALDVSITYIETASKLTPEELRQVRQGKVTLAGLKPPAPAPVKSKTTLEDVAAWWRSASETDRAAVVSEIGIAPLWDKIAETLV